MAPYEAWIREQVIGSEPGPAFPTQSWEPQAGPWEPRDENCTVALPGEGAGRLDGGWTWEIGVGVETAGSLGGPLTQASHSSECGIAPRPGAWPWEARVMVPGSRPCHGALVSESWVLAPARCFLE